MVYGVLKNHRFIRWDGQELGAVFADFVGGISHLRFEMTSGERFEMTGGARFYPSP